jgi:hypothetical protein
MAVSAAHNLELARIANWNCSPCSVSCFESSENQKEEMRDAIRVGSKLRSLDNGRLRDRESRSAIPVLGRHPVRDRDGDPAEGRQPADHRDGNCRQKTER